MTKPEKFDNGGAEAIRGFNFQKANLILLAINNYEKPNFKIYIEAEDDIVVSYDNYKAFIQVKKQTHTFNSLLKKERKSTSNKNGNKKNYEKLSILEKNLNAGNVGDVFKIFVKDIGVTDKKSLNTIKPGQICFKLYQINDDAKKNNFAHLTDEHKSKLNNFFLYISPLGEDFEDAQNFLIGSLNKIDVAVDNKQGRNIIAELVLNIENKSQHIIEDKSHKELKYMDSAYFSNVFITSNAINKFDSVLDSLGFNSIKASRVKKERLKIDLTRVTLKEEIKEYIVNLEELEELSDLEIIDLVLEKYSFIDTKNILIAIGIECICEIGE